MPERSAKALILLPCLALYATMASSQPTGYYDMPATGVSGVVPIQRIVPDNIPLCESLIETE